jgi:hypothetical protein
MYTGENIPNEWEGMNPEQGDASKKTPFSVPDGYFDNLASQIMGRIRTSEISAAEEIRELSPLLAGLSRTLPFQVPAGYFEDNIQVLPVLTAADPVPSFSRIMPYEIPAGYFESLPDRILARFAEPKAKVIPIMRRKWMKLAVAACVAAVITISGLVYMNRPASSGASGADPLASELKSVPTSELDAFLNSVEGSSATAQGTVRTGEVKELLQDVSDKELDAFLEQLPADDDLAFN